MIQCAWNYHKRCTEQISSFCYICNASFNATCGLLCCQDWRKCAFAWQLLTRDAAVVLYIGWSDLIYLWSQCDRHFVGQHVVLCVVKWWRFIALFESNCMVACICHLLFSATIHYFFQKILCCAPCPQHNILF